MLEGELTNLRPIDRLDRPLVFDWLSAPENSRWWGWTDLLPTEAATNWMVDEWLALAQLYRHPVAWIVETLDGDPIGLVVLSDIEPLDRRTELSFFLVASARNRGLGSDMLQTVVEALFSDLGYHRITVKTEDHNQAAQALLARHGFRIEGRLREARYIDGRWHDMLIYGRIDVEHRDE